MDDLLSLLERWSPGYQGLVEGVMDWSVEELEETLGLELPGFYRSFLRRMGREGGPLLAELGAYRPHNLVELYACAPWELPPRRYLFIAGDRSLAAQPYFLDLESPAEQDDRLVVRCPLMADAWKTALAPEFVSLREMLYFLAMDRVYLPTFPERAEYVLPTWNRPADELTSVAAASDLFQKLGFARLPYPRHCLLFERPGAAIALHRPVDGAGFSFEVGARDAQELRRFEAVVADRTDLIPRAHM